MATETKKSKLSAADLNNRMNYVKNATFCTTGSVVLDALMGGGMPEGGFIEMFSPSGIGKSTCALHISRSLCESGKKVIYMDVEGGLNPRSLSSFGLDAHLYDDVDNPEGKMMLLNASTYEEAEEVMEYALEPDNEIACIVIDSITMLLPSNRLEKGVEEVKIAVDASIMTNFLKKYSAICNKKKLTVFFINQVRTTIDTRTGARVEGAGGMALKHLMQVRIKLRKKQALTKTVESNMGKDIVPFGAVLEATCIKSRYGFGERKTELVVYFGKGISNLYTFKDLLETKGMIKQGGAGWYTSYLYEGEDPLKHRNLAALEMYLKENYTQVVALVDSFGGVSIESEEEIQSRMSHGKTHLLTPPTINNDVVLKEGDEISVKDDAGEE